MEIFKNKNFIMVMLARLMINFADSLFYILIIWYSSKTLGSAYYTSIATFLFLIPETLLIFIGPVIDKLNQKEILLFSVAIQIVLMLLLIVFGHDNINFLLFIVLISSFMSAITYPIEEAIIPQIVDTESLVTANSVLEVTYKIFDSLFNGISGFLLVAYSTSTLFKVNLFAFILPLFIILFIKFKYVQSEDSYSFNEYVDDLKEGSKFVINSPLIYMLVPLIFVNFFNSSNAVILPFFSQQYQNPSETFGLIMSIKGIGGIIGAILINYVKKILPTGKLLSVLLVLNGFFWTIFLFTGGKLISYVFLLIAYIFFGMYNIIYSSLFQAITPIKFMGRITTSIDTIITIAMPLGTLFGGMILNFLPYNISMLFSAIAVIITGIFYYKSKQINQLPYIDNIERIQIIE
ncbi:MAG: MFS transporter [Paraclostridium sp.]